jgi:hypothetical protein
VDGGGGNKVRRLLVERRFSSFSLALWHFEERRSEF